MGTFDAFGNFVPSSCPSGGTVVGYNLAAISICAGPPASPTPTPTKLKPSPTPTLTPCPQATSTAVEVGSQAVFHAEGTFIRGKKERVVDITNSRDILWTSANNPPGGPEVLLPPTAGNGGVYNAVAQGCACVDASAGGTSAPMVGVTIFSSSAPTPACPLCPTPAPTPTPALSPARPSVRVSSGAPPGAALEAAGIAGTLNWTFDAGMPLAGPLVPGPYGRLYFITADGMLHALDAGGRERWRRASGGAAPAVAGDGTIYALGYALGQGASLQALSPRGKPLWNLEIGSGSGPLAASGGAVYVQADGELSAISAPGLVQWHIPAAGEIAATAATADGGIVVGATGATLTAVSPEGAVRWSFEPEGGFAGGVAALGDRVYAGSGVGVLYALDASSGAELWRLTTLGPVRAGPVAGSSALLFFESDSLYAAATDGRIAWRKSLSSSGPFAADGRGGVFARDSRAVDVFSNPDGSVRWSTRSFGPAAQAVVSSAGVLYVATTDGHVYAVR